MAELHDQEQNANMRDFSLSRGALTQLPPGCFDGSQAERWGEMARPERVMHPAQRVSSSRKIGHSSN
jgi:hypothetical protein